MSKAVGNLDGEAALLKGRQVAAVGVVRVEEANEAPADGGKDEQEGAHSGCEGVAQVQDQESREEGASSTGNLVKDMDGGVHALELDDVATDNVLGDDAADELNHTVADTDDRIDGEEDERVPLAVALNLADGELAPCGDINDDDEGGEETEEEDGPGEDGLCGEALDQGGNGDGTDALEGLVQALENAQVREGVFFVETVGGQQGDGAGECFLLWGLRNKSNKWMGDCVKDG